MTDLQSGRGPMNNRRARALLWMAMLMFLASHGADPLGAPPLAKYAVIGLGLIALVSSIKLQRRSDRRATHQ